MEVSSLGKLSSSKYKSFLQLANWETSICDLCTSVSLEHEEKARKRMIKSKHPFSSPLSRFPLSMLQQSGNLDLIRPTFVPFLTIKLLYQVIYTINNSRNQCCKIGRRKHYLLETWIKLSVHRTCTLKKKIGKIENSWHRNCICCGKKVAMGQSMNKRKSFHESELFMYKYVFLNLLHDKKNILWF